MAKLIINVKLNITEKKVTETTRKEKLLNILLDLYRIY